MTTTTKGRHTEGDQPHWVEWVTGIISAALVLFILSWIAVEAFTHTAEPPELEVAEVSEGATASGYRVTFEISNSSNTTAAAVVVRAELRERGEVVEEAEVTFDYVPAQSLTRGAVLFATDPAGRELTLRAIGFTDP
ncbi:TIGR02588 family protein [Rhizobium sp. RU36D]|uniref:TIGR02588 family protein n=1 Tax=Rhizobium sp. RU36D TaxID=1907415 RepID=UPI0009D89EDA|nr:TIGR02588 family protein [Rhizobium sp. RU36D]SMC59020.1 TIGR02588 family protein [Rhizobium sp. RU36D]